MPQRLGKRLLKSMHPLSEGDPRVMIGKPFLKILAVLCLEVALFGAAWERGYFGLVLAEDLTGVVVPAIFGTFAVGVLWALFACGKVNAQHAYLQRNEFEGVEEALRLSLTRTIGPVRHIASSLVVLGLIGTVLGFIIALSGVDPSSASDVGAIGPMVSTLIEGMSVALYTTLLGAILNLALMLLYRIIEDGALEILALARR